MTIFRSYDQAGLDTHYNTRERHLPDYNHFTVLDMLAASAKPLFQATCALAVRGGESGP